MTKYEKLLTYCEELGIKIKEIDFKSDKKIGYNQDNYILINSNVPEQQKYELLAEELGHFKTTFGNIVNQATINDVKQELKARRYGYNKIVSLEGIIEAFEKNCLTAYEIAEYLEVSYEYFNDCINDYRKQYGLYHQINNYCIVFEPTLSICKYFN